MLTATTATSYSVEQCSTRGGAPNSRKVTVWGVYRKRVRGSMLSIAFSEAGGRRGAMAAARTARNSGERREWRRRVAAARQSAGGRCTDGRRAFSCGLRCLRTAWCAAAEGDSPETLYAHPIAAALLATEQGATMSSDHCGIAARLARRSRPSPRVRSASRLFSSKQAQKHFRRCSTPSKCPQAPSLLMNFCRLPRRRRRRCFASPCTLHPPSILQLTDVLQNGMISSEPAA